MTISWKSRGARCQGRFGLPEFRLFHALKEYQTGDKEEADGDNGNALTRQIGYDAVHQRPDDC